MISYGVQSPSDDKLQVIKQNGNLNHNNNNVKHPLKRVSFGSSKGSMVETLIYDHPLPEEDVSYYEANITRFGGVVTHKTEPETEQKRIENQIRPPSKVRVTFFEAEKPTYVSSPESADCSLEFGELIPVMSTSSPNHEKNPGYIRQLSTDSGKDNPFRPDGDLSREADQIVEMIREGRPITLTPTPELPEHELDGILPGSDYDGKISPVMVNDVHVSPERKSTVVELQQHKPGANGNAAPKGDFSTDPEQPVEIQRGVAAPPQDASQVEHVVIKKKPKCKCCEIM